MQYNFTEEFEGLTNGEIIRDVVGTQQVDLLRQWMGRGVRGAKEAIGQPLPSQLNELSLRAYHEIARRMVAHDNDPQGTQAARIELIEHAIDEIGRSPSTD